MSSITIRNIDPAVKERLRVRAAEHGHSMEAEARDLLRQAVESSVCPDTRDLVERIRARFAPFGGVDLDLPPRDPVWEPPRFD